MLTAIEVRNARGGIMTLNLEDISDGFIVGDIQGLDPVKATLVSSSYASIDGAQYQSARREPRNLVMPIGLEPPDADTSVRDLRNQLYAFFMPKTQVELRFIHDEADSDLIVYTMARVEDFDCPLFVKEPEATIMMQCFDPDFLALDEEVVGGTTVEDTTEEEIEYSGTVEAGIEFELTIDRVLTEFTIYHRLPDNSVRSLDISGDFIAGDLLTISTIKGEKHVSLLRAGTTTSILYAMSVQSNWIELEQGTNYIRVYAVGAPILWSITYTPRYGGL